MKNSINSTALFLTGALVGAAAVLLLKSDKGKQLRQELADLADDFRTVTKPTQETENIKEA